MRLKSPFLAIVCLSVILCCLPDHRACAQDTEFSNVLKFTKEGTITAFLSCDGYLIDENCATFRREMPTDENLRTDGEVLDFSIGGALIGITTYRKGIKHGLSKGYYQNGTLRYEGSYSGNLRVGTWSFYYINGDLEKLIRYENGTPRLMTSSNEKGKLTVRRGNGAFEGTVMLDRLSCREYIVTGVVRNGFMDGRWTIKDKYTQVVLYKETYRNGRFIEGKDSSVDESQLYLTNPRASFVGYVLLENAYYFSDIPCAESPKLSLYNGKRNLSSLYYRITEELKLNAEANGRALVNIKLDSSGVNEVSIHSTLAPQVEQKLRDYLMELEGWNTRFVKSEENRFFILMIQDGSVEIPDLNRVESQGNTVLPDYEVGEYERGERVGIWNFYNDNKVLELTVDFDKPAVNYFLHDTTRFIVQDAGTWQRKSVDRPAMYLGSSKVQKDFLTDLIEYPREAIKQRVQGECLFSFEISPEGFAENLSIIEDMGYGTRKEVESALNQWENLWIPAIVKGKPVRTLFYVRVSFSFDENPSSSRFVKPYFLEVSITP